MERQLTSGPERTLSTNIGRRHILAGLGGLVLGGVGILTAVKPGSAQEQTTQERHRHDHHDRHRRHDHRDRHHRDA